METAEQVSKSKRTISPELKERMRAGRARAAANRKAGNAKPVLVRRKDAPPLVPAPDKRRKLVVHNSAEAADEFTGLTPKDCPVACTAERCAIGGSLVMENGESVGHCTHPCKGGLQPIHQMKPEIVARYNRAKKFLKIEEIERQRD